MNLSTARIARSAAAADVARSKATKRTKANGHTAEVMEALGVVPKWDSLKELKQLRFGQMVEKRTQLMDEIKFREAKKGELDEEISAALAVAGVEKVEWEDRNVQIVHKAGARKIVAEKLLERGVDADVIAESTEEGKGYSYLLVGKPKQD